MMTPSAAPLITSRMKCTPASTRVTAITAATISMIAPIGMLIYRKAIAMMKADTVWRDGKLLPLVSLGTAGV